PRREASRPCSTGVLGAPARRAAPVATARRTTAGDGRRRQSLTNAVEAALALLRNGIAHHPRRACPPVTLLRAEPGHDVTARDRRPDAGTAFRRVRAGHSGWTVRLIHSPPGRSRARSRAGRTWWS